MAEINIQVTPPASVLIQVSTPGPQGAQGPAGTAQAYRYTQIVLSDIWTVNHNLGRRPIVQLETIGGVMMVADIVHLSNNIFQVVLDSPSVGVAAYI